jgi:hypothetical protein
MRQRALFNRGATSTSSWLNQVEHFFALLTDKKIRRGIYRSVNALRTDIDFFISHHNPDPKPFKWTKPADNILASIERFCRYYAPPKMQYNAANFCFGIRAALVRSATLVKTCSKT